MVFNGSMTSFPVSEIRIYSYIDQESNIQIIVVVLSFKTNFLLIFHKTNRYTLICNTFISFIYCRP